MIKRCDKGNLHSFEDVPIKTEESEVESEIDAIFSSQRSAYQGRRNGQICL